MMITLNLPHEYKQFWNRFMGYWQPGDVITSDKANKIFEEMGCPEIKALVEGTVGTVVIDENDLPFFILKYHV